MMLKKSNRSSRTSLCLLSFGLLISLASSQLIASAQINTKGDGVQAAPVIPGDSLTMPVPSNLSVSTDSTFKTTYRRLPSIIYLRTDTYSHSTKEQRGKRLVLTINPNTIHNAMTLDLISSILHLDLNQTHSQSAIWLDVNNKQLEQIQRVIAPSANDLSSIVHLDSDQRKHIFQDSTANIELKSGQWFSRLPVVRQFSRYSILFGVVMATVLFSLAAYGLTMGERGSGQRIIGTAAGLLILLMAFTIYKLLVNNMINSNVTTSTISITQ